MKAKVKSTQQVVEVTCTDRTTQDPYLYTWEDGKGGSWLGSSLTFDDLTDYKTWTENLIHDLAVAEFKRGPVVEGNRKQLANDIVLFAFAVLDAMQRENKASWR